MAAVFPPRARRIRCFAAAPGQIVVAFWMLPAGRREDVLALQERGITAIALEAIADAYGRAPVLESMSEIAGSLAITVGACLLLSAFGGKGVLIGGAPGVPPAHVAILGAGALAGARPGRRWAWGAGDAARHAAGGAARGHAASGRTWPPCCPPPPTWRRPSPSPTSCWARWRVHGERAPGAGDAGDMLAPDAAAQRGGGPVHRHGGLLRDLAADRLSRPHLRGGRDPALLRAEPARGGRPLRPRSPSPTPCCRISSRWPDSGLDHALAAIRELRRGTSTFTRGRCARRVAGARIRPAPGPAAVAAGEPHDTGPRATAAA